MMKTQNYFVFAVMISILIPIAIGSIYFIDVYNKRGEKDYLSKANNLDEVLILGDTDLSSISNNESSDFLVKFTYGKNNIRKFKIVLNNLNFQNNDYLKNIKWKLMMYDESTNEYLGLKSGNFEMIKNSKLDISPLIYIELGKTQKFKFVYNLNIPNEDNKNYKLKGNLDVELE